MTAAGTLARAGIVVSAAFLLSRALGWVRVVVIVNAFGASRELDAFYAAFRIPDLIFQLVAAGALSSALIPVVAALVTAGEESRAWRVVSTVANLMLVALLVLAVAMAILAPVIVPIITPGFDPELVERTVTLTRIMLLSPIFLALGAVATSVLNARNAFGAAALAPVVYNVVIIAAALFLAPLIGVEGLAIGVVLGSLGHLVIQLRPLARLGARYAPRIEAGDPQARRALALMAPRAVGLGASQITFIVVTSLATTIGVGAVTAYNVAFTLLQIPVGVIGVPLGVVLFPSLSQQVAAGQAREYLALLTRALRLLLFTMLPIGGLLAVVRHEVVAILFPRFDATTVELVADTLLFFLAGLAAHALIAVLARAFYARQDTRTPVAAAVLAVAINTTAAIVLVGPLGLQGIALAIAGAAWIEALVLLALISRRSDGFEGRALLRVGLESAVGTVLAATAGVVGLAILEALVPAEPGLVGLVARLIVASAAFGAVYLGVSGALRIPELPSIVAVMTDVVRRRSRP